jgi:hypothetical protein
MQYKTAEHTTIDIDPVLPLPTPEIEMDPYTKYMETETRFYNEITEANAKFCFETLYNMMIKRDYATHDQKLDKCSICSIGELIIYILFEFYKGTVGIYLTIFVPQRCLHGNSTSECGLFDNVTANPHYTAAFSMNIVTAAFFVALYLLELWREYKITTYLLINKSDKSGILGIHASPDGEKLMDDQLRNFRDDDLPTQCPIYNNFITNRIILVLAFYNTLYKYAVLICLTMFTINTILSSSVIITYNTKNQSSYIGLITNVSVYLPKLYDICSLIVLDKFEYSKNTYSSYKKIFAQYNNYNHATGALIKIELDKQREFYVADRNAHMREYLHNKYMQCIYDTK